MVSSIFIVLFFKYSYFIFQYEDLGDIGELSNENDSSDDEGLEFDESDEDQCKDEESGDGSQNDSADEAESDSGTMFSDDIEWETDSESESKSDEKKINSNSKETKGSVNSISGTSNAIRKGKSLKKVTANLSKSDTDDKNDNKSSELNQSKVDEYGEGDTSDEEVSCNLVPTFYIRLFEN